MNLSLQDLLAILGPMGTFMGFIWHNSKTKLEKIDRRFENLDEKINRRFGNSDETINRRFGNLDETINRRFEKLDEKINHRFEDLDVTINRRFENLDEKFEKKDKKIDNLKAELINVEKRLGEKIDAVRDRVSRIEGQLAPASIVAFNPPRQKKTTTATQAS